LVINKRYFLIVIFFLFLIQLGFTFGNRETEEKPKTIQVTGIVRLVGSDTFPEIVISGSGYEWYVPREERSKLNNLQHRTVTVEGEETVLQLMFANGMPAGTRRELKNIKIIKIH